MSAPGEGTDLGSLEQVPVGEGRAFAVDGQSVAVFHLRDGGVRALGAICPHRGGPLADGLVDGAVVVCPLHGHTFDLVSGQETEHGGEPARAYLASTCPAGTVRVQAR